MKTEICILPEPYAFFCSNAFWLKPNTPLRVVQTVGTDDPNRGSDLSHVRTEHSDRTVEEERDHTCPSPWAHPCIWMAECSE